MATGFHTHIFDRDTVQDTLCKDKDEDGHDHIWCDPDEGTLTGRKSKQLGVKPVQMKRTGTQKTAITVGQSSTVTSITGTVLGLSNIAFSISDRLSADATKSAALKTRRGLTGSINGKQVCRYNSDLGICQPIKDLIVLRKAHM